MKAWLAVLVVASVAVGQSMEERAKKVIEIHSAEIRPLEKTLNLAWWDANVSGSDADFERKQKAQNAFDERLADTKYFAEVKAVREGLPKTADPDLRRQVEVLYLMLAGNQVPVDLLKKIAAKSNAIEQVFNNFRAKVDGRELTDSQVKKVLKESVTSTERQKVWEASKQVGAAVEKDLKELVSLRNQAAKKLGYPNYHSMLLQLNEQNPKDILKLFDDLDTLTSSAYKAVKGEIDRRLAKTYKVQVGQLYPWHYHDPFFQEAPSVFEVDLDAQYAKLDIMQLSRDFYAGMGLPIDDVIARSDLYEKKGKSPHAFCTDIDREGDVRVLANVVPNEAWMGTMLHELGHAVYSSKNIPLTVPYLLRTDAHILATEGIAMLFEKFSKSADWLEGMGVKVADAEAFNRGGRKLEQAKLLIFSRWAQVMFRFEKSLYENPQQNLNKLWWDLVERYQMVKRPPGRNAPDYGSKVHVVVAPAYYHNYLMGQLFASQVHHTVAKSVLKSKPESASYIGRKDVGDYFKTKVFAPGRRMSWNDLTRFATGQTLNPRAFAADIAH